MTGPTLISVVVDEAMIPVDRALGVLRRRNLRIRSLTLGPGPVEGTTRVLAEAEAAPADAERLVGQLRKLVGVRQAEIETAHGNGSRQLVLVRLRPAGERGPALAAALERNGATVLEAGPLGSVVQVTGTPTEVHEGLRALAPFGVIDTAWSGLVALAAAPGAAEAATSTEDEWS